MAEQAPRADNELLEEQQASSQKGIGGKIKAVAFIAFVIAIECAVAYFYIPDSAQTAAIAGATLGIDPETGEIPADEPDESAQVKVDQVEVPLGEYSVTTFQPVSNTTLRIDFQLYGTIATKDEIEFFRRMEENRHRFREQVIVTIRTADITDFTEAQLGLVRRRVLERSNRILGAPLLRGVIFSDFSFIEQ
ncbi:MAG: hypothetical protein RBS80_13470 [Thermoguttaceae bacterium]|jgi:flagellar FliL protein|nr:hypothetical protein [Thermoguttaceae bacterium]